MPISTVKYVFNQGIQEKSGKNNWQPNYNLLFIGRHLETGVSQRPSCKQPHCLAVWADMALKLANWWAEGSVRVMNAYKTRLDAANLC